MSEGDKLIALQEQDLAIARAEKSLDELPEKLAILQLRKRLKEIEAVRDKARGYCRKVDAMVSKSNDEAASIQAKIDAEQAKVLSGEVTNPKELQNLTRELDALKRRKDAVEHEELGLMEKAESGQAQLAKVESALAEGAEKESALIEEFKIKGGELTRDIAAMKRTREKLAGHVQAELLRRYESLRSSKHGIGAGTLSGDLCSACRTQIPAGKAQALQAGPEIAECPNCKRILVVREPQA
jgi:predicted  nucleic acid-binding Zn-ribbon protein